MNNQELKGELKKRAELPQKMLNLLREDPSLNRRVLGLSTTLEARLAELEGLYCWVEARE